jgi:hypothetical protein
MSGPAQGTIQIDADVSKAIQKVMQIGVAMGKAGQQGAKGMDGFGASVLKTAFGIGAITTAIGSVQKTIMSTKDAMVQMSSDAGKMRLALAGAAAAAGFKGKEDFAKLNYQVFDMPGATSTEDRFKYAMASLQGQAQLQSAVTPAGQRYMTSRKKSVAENLANLKDVAELGATGAFGADNAELLESFVSRNMTAKQARSYSLGRRPGLADVIDHPLVKQEIEMAALEQQKRQAAQEAIDHPPGPGWLGYRDLNALDYRRGAISDRYDRFTPADQHLKPLRDLPGAVPLVGDALDATITGNNGSRMDRGTPVFDLLKEQIRLQQQTLQQTQKPPRLNVEGNTERGR